MITVSIALLLIFIELGIFIISLSDESTKDNNIL